MFINCQRAQLSYFCSLSYNSTICPTCPTFFGFLSYILEICPTFLKFSFFSFQNQGKIAETYAYSKNVTLYCFLCQSCVDKYRYFVNPLTASHAFLCDRRIKSRAPVTRKCVTTFGPIKLGSGQ